MIVHLSSIVQTDKCATILYMHLFQLSTQLYQLNSVKTFWKECIFALNKSVKYLGKV